MLKKRLFIFTTIIGFFSADLINAETISDVCETVNFATNLYVIKIVLAVILLFLLLALMGLIISYYVPKKKLFSKEFLKKVSIGLGIAIGILLLPFIMSFILKIAKVDYRVSNCFIDVKMSTIKELRLKEQNKKEANKEEPSDSLEQSSEQFSEQPSEQASEQSNDEPVSSNDDNDEQNQSVYQEPQGNDINNISSDASVEEKREYMVKLIEGELGYCEKDNSKNLYNSTGHCSKSDGNYTKYPVEIDFNGQGLPWCGIFVTWAIKKAGLDDVISIPTGLASVPTWYRHSLKYNNVRTREDIANGTYTPRPGDIIMYFYNRSDAAPGHIGIVYKYDSNDRRQQWAIDGNYRKSGTSTDAVSINKFGSNGAFATWVFLTY